MKKNKVVLPVSGNIGRIGGRVSLSTPTTGRRLCPVYIPLRRREGDRYYKERHQQIVTGYVKPISLDGCVWIFREYIQNRQFSL